MEDVGSSEEISFIDQMPIQLEVLLDMPSVPLAMQHEHAWSSEDRSDNIWIKEDDPLTFHRHPVAQSTDGIRSKYGYVKGLHVFEITWPNRQRGTHAVVGVSTIDAPLKVLDIKLWLEAMPFPGDGTSVEDTTFYVPETFRGESHENSILTNMRQRAITITIRSIVVLNMDQGNVGYIVNGRYLGTAFHGFRGKKLYLMVSSVWGHCEVTMKYIGGIDAEPLPLLVLCRRVIRKSIEDMEEDKVEKLDVPKILVNYLTYKDHVSVISSDNFE